MTKAGIVTVAGFPNAGKSTLLNQLVGEKLAITSPKAQSTRHRIVGIRTADGAQMIVLDTPGLLEPRDTLHAAMRNAALAAVRDADVLVHVVDATALIPESFERAAGLEKTLRAPVILALNKSDLLDDERRARLVAAHPNAVAWLTHLATLDVRWRSFDGIGEEMGCPDHVVEEALHIPRSTRRGEGKLFRVCLAEMV